MEEEESSKDSGTMVYTPPIGGTYVMHDTTPVATVERPSGTFLVDESIPLTSPNIPPPVEKQPEIIELKPRTAPKKYVKQQNKRIISKENRNDN